MSGLVDGGVDLLMIETVFDTQNCKAMVATMFGFLSVISRESLLK